MYDLKDYGIAQNRVETAAIQRVFDEASAAGGTVLIPAGVYMSGTLNIGRASIYLERGAVFKASPNIGDYTPNGFIHNELRQVTSFLYSMHESGISISGEGTIDLSGEAFYDMDTPDVPDYGVEFTEEQKAECTRPIGVRPTQPIFFYDCRSITVRDITIINAPCWTMSFNSCEDIRVLDITVNNSLVIPNNDGMHFCSCRNGIIRGCNISSGDDCIALSCITDWNRPCENFVISDCILRSVSKAVVFGYIHSIVRNVTMSNCIIYDSQRGVCVMSSKGTGLVEHIEVGNCRIDTHVRAGNWWGNGEVIEVMALPHSYAEYLNSDIHRSLDVNVRDVHFHDIACTGENIAAVIGDGNIEDVTFDRVTFTPKESKNRYLKGDRVIDVSPSKERVEVPEGCGWLYVR